MVVYDLCICHCLFRLLLVFYFRCCSVFFFFFFFFNDTATTEIYTLSLHDALPICMRSHAGAIGGEHRPVRRGGVPLHPCQQGGPEVEAHGSEGSGHGGVALPLDALVPVVVRRGGRLTGDGAQPRVVARWLVEVAVNHDGPHAS